ncbi:MAG TPA: hypothetical protein VFJ12_05455, partial [Segeticoccus sp.]|nr:hypothetical protein [Segeticoccus sp.]
ASTLRFVPDEGDAEVYDLFRAQPERTDDQSEAWNRRRYTFAFPALPFVRSGVRETPAAVAPGVTLDGFESSRMGVFLTEPQSVNAGDSIAMPTAGAAAVPITAFNVNPAGSGTIVAFSPVSNCTGDGFPLTVTAPGDAEAVTATSWAVPEGVDYVTGGMNLSAGSAAVAGVEWLDAGGVSLGIDWGLPRADNLYEFAPWVVAKRPAGAASVQLRLRLLAAAAGDRSVYQGALSGAATQTVTFSAAVAHDGSSSLLVPAVNDPSTEPPNRPVGYLYAPLGAPVDVAAWPWLSLWLRPTSQAANFDYPSPDAASNVLSLRLFDTQGRWTRYRVTGSVDTGWHRIGWDRAADVAETSPDGAPDLSAVVAYDVEIHNIYPWYVDTIAAGPEPSSTTSQYGTVLGLDIVGAARSPVMLTVTGAAPMTDCLIATADPAVPPMLATAGSEATAAAPAAYDGVYRVIGTLAAADAVGSPTCTVAQLIDGVQVASEVLDGTQTDGNHYVDFGVVPLPMVGVPDDNRAVSYTFTLSPGGAAWSEVLVLNVDQPMAWLPNLAEPMAYGWIDEPEPTAQMGRVWVGSTADRSDARSPADPPDLSLPFSVRAPATQLLVYSTSGAPDVSLSYYPRRLS